MLGILRNKYRCIAVVALVVFVVVWIVAGIADAFFSLIIFAAMLVYFFFDPRLKRHR